MGVEHLAKGMTRFQLLFTGLQRFFRHLVHGDMFS